MAADLLSAKAIENAKSTDKPWTMNDGNGLNVLIHPNGSKYFQLRCTLHGKPKLVRLGIYPDLSLAKARVNATEARRLVAEGIDPVQMKRVQAAQKATSAASTFQSVAEQWLTIKKRTLAPSSYRKIAQTFSANIYPRFGAVPIKDIDAHMVRTAMQAMEKRGATELMEKCRAWVREVFEFALGELIIERNPIPQKDLLLIKHKVTNHPRLKSREDTAQFLRNLAEYQGRTETRLAIWLQILLATRPGELRLAEWPEFDLEKGLWTVPVERMKTRKHMTEPFVVTLSRQAIEALKELHELTSYSKLVFPSLTNSTKPMSDMTLAKALRSVWTAYRIVPHGFRHLGLYSRATVIYRPLDRDRTMPLLLAFILIGFFIWLAENVGTFYGVWRYPNQIGAWAAVHIGKWSSWSLCVIMTFTIVANLKHIKASIHIPD